MPSINGRPTLKRNELDTYNRILKAFSLPLPPLDGLMLANALHFVKNKPSFLQNIRKYLLPRGSFILVEYDTHTANRYVPYPISFRAAATLFKQAGFELFEKINEHPSIYNRAGMYGAHCVKR